MIVATRKLQIRSQKIIAYTKFTGFHFRTEAQQKSADQLKAVKTYTGRLAPSAKKRLAKAIDILVQSTKRTWVNNPATGKRMPFQVGFMTLTVHSPERNIDQKEAYKNLLSHFLQWLRRSHNCYLYIWKAELQERGQIHYHLLLGKFIPYDEIRAKWNELQAKHGYLDAYYKEHGHYNAPSTEIKNALEHGDVAGYLIKEIGKSIQNITGIGGKVWDCSTNLKEAGLFEVDADTYADTIAQLTRESKLMIGFSDNSCTVYKANDFKPYNALNPLDRWLYKDHLDYVSTNELVRLKPRDIVYAILDKPPPKAVYKQQSIFFAN